MAPIRQQKNFLVTLGLLYKIFQEFKIFKGYYLKTQKWLNLPEMTISRLSIHGDFFDNFM